LNPFSKLDYSQNPIWLWRWPAAMKPAMTAFISVGGKRG
jgi:hypothetical protein